MPGVSDKEHLTEQSWTLIEQALQSGTITLPSGESRVVTTKELLTVVRWLASLNAVRRRRQVALPDAFMRLGHGTPGNGS